MVVNRLTLIVAATVLFLVRAGGAAFAQPADHASQAGLQSLDSIRASAVAGLRGMIDGGLAGVTLEAASLDSRLRLPSCPEKLGTFVTAPRHNQSRAPVRVSCKAPAWTVHVPVDIRRSHPVLVLRRAVGRGETLVAADVSVQTRELPGLASPFVAGIAQLDGRLTRRPIPEGAALPADALTAALLIHRGQIVTLVAQTDGFEVRAPGKAMADAAARQRVRVQNLNSLKIIEGVADTDGVVRVLP
jgi:flagella basal body P-ring formation protein FlgA